MRHFSIKVNLSNMNCIAGLTELPPIQHLFIEFFINPFIAVFDIRKCYRSIYTSEETNALRIIPIWQDKDDVECSGILKFQRMCFGDVSASAILLLSCAHFVLPSLTSPLARKVLNALYVDDSLSGCRSKTDLEEAVNQVIEKLANFGFFPKFIYFNWKEPPKEVGEELTVFHQNWNIKTYEIAPNIKFNIHSKNRGVAKGCDLTKMTVEEIEQVKVTKTLLARLIGQIYDLSGFLAPIRATLLSLFSKVCLLLNDWTSALPPESEVAASVTAVLKELAADLPLIRPLPRCKIPDGATLQRIVVFSDASLDVVAFATYLEVRHANLSVSCDFLFANSYTRHASIPSLEMLAFIIGLNELHGLISKHSLSLLLESTVRIDFMLDSECTLHSLNVNRLSKSILIKNSKDKMVCHLAQITKGFNLVD